MLRLGFGDCETLPDGIVRHVVIHCNIGCAVLIETKREGGLLLWIDAWVCNGAYAKQRSVPTGERRGGLKTTGEVKKTRP